jgi:uncharacterized protein YbgA (DUF1722 family)/uncharacterized protein YbbK (DUF523 family)
MQSIKVGVSGCLIGQKVRYNGSDKYQRFIAKDLTDFVSLVPFCPEVAAGLGTPRTPIRLIRTDRGHRAVEVTDYQKDVTDTLQQQALKADWVGSLCGYIFMQKSPSCGVFRVKSYNPENNIPDEITEGVFARVIRERFPWLPVEEAGRLNDAKLAENFLSRVLVLADWREQVEPHLSAKALLEFHARHKYLLMARDQNAYKQLGRELADLKNVDLEQYAPQYLTRLMQALANKSSRGQQVNALLHIKGYLKKFLSDAEQRSLAEQIDLYQKGQVPLVVPMTMMRHFLNLHYLSGSYIQQQSFLAPTPDVLGFRNRY